MVRNVIATQAITPAGTAGITMGTPDATGSVADVGEDLTLIVRNGDVSSKTVTVQTGMQVNGLDVAEVVLTVTAGSIACVALDPRLFKRPSAPDAGKVYIDYSAITSVTAAVIQR